MWQRSIKYAGSMSKPVISWPKWVPTCLRRKTDWSRTQFSSSGHLSVCAFVTDSTTENNEICKDITVNDEISFDSVELCAPEPACNLEFRVSVNATEISCEGWYYLELLMCNKWSRISCRDFLQVSGSSPSRHNLATQLGSTCCFNCPTIINRIYHDVIVLIRKFE